MFNVENFAFINEQFFVSAVEPANLDRLLADGWRHFGHHFFRYNLAFYTDEIRFVYPLRIDLPKFSFSKSQRRILKRNSDLRVEYGPATISETIIGMFERHAKRFTHSVPDSIFDFLAERPADGPCDTRSCFVYNADQLIAISFFDVGSVSLSSVYGIFEPDYADRSLGIFTMLREIEYAVENKLRHYYHGYVYEGNSFYDYKKRFRALEVYDWNGNWRKAQFQNDSGETSFSGG
ncbi:MAG TPA: GNAT family N-acetyltransferase [Pyrinomonadaceae bacterium]|nr:GNAT family N-acetyltransferase [Pyrinomonadaceae bacterium]HNU07271.1 GNAT family N-acetyltransferase [Pyrinomonadaceae bacterium]